MLVRPSPWPTGGSLLPLTYGSSLAGSNDLSVSGVTNIALGGIYTGAISAAAVPEPQTYAMFAAGLAAIGFLVSRRRG